MAEDETTEGDKPEADRRVGMAGADQSDGSSPDSDPLVGSTIDQYRVVRLIGRGGMGAVYEALNTRIQKRVALKFIDARLAGSADAVLRFQREAQAASAVESPNIVQIFDAGTTADGVAFLVMELLPGCDLGCHLRAVGRMELEPALQLTAQILKALHQAHQAGIVHRDLKPDNVFLVEREGEVAVIKLLDFGVSKIAERDGVPLETLTKEGTVVGTPHYMSPEQAQGLADVGAAADLYATGAILFECLAGRTPHVGRSYEQIIVRICTQDAEDVRELAPDIPEPVALVLARALARHRSQRFRSAAEMLEALIEASPASLRDRMQSGVFAMAPGAVGSNRASRPGSGARQGGSSGSGGRLLTPTQTADVGSASTIAAPVVPSGPPPASDKRYSTAASQSSRTGERTAPPSTLPTFQPHAARRTRRVVAVVALGLLVGVGATLFAVRHASVSSHSEAGSAGNSPDSVNAEATTGGAAGRAASAASADASASPEATAQGGSSTGGASSSGQGANDTDAGGLPNAASTSPAPPRPSHPGSTATASPGTAAAPPLPVAPPTAEPAATDMGLWRDPSLPPTSKAP